MNPIYLDALKSLASCKRPAMRSDFELLSIKHRMPIQKVMIDYGAVLAGEI
jgi:hypothetical protein